MDKDESFMRIKKTGYMRTRFSGSAITVLPAPHGLWPRHGTHITADILDAVIEHFENIR